MSKLRVHTFSISLDGYGAGPNQGPDNPLGVDGLELHKWLRGTRTFGQLFGNSGGATGLDDDFALRGLKDIGAWILGRNMFGPVRGPWPDEHWKGWWGENPPYHMPVYILTHIHVHRSPWRDTRRFTLSPMASMRRLTAREMPQMEKTFDWGVEWP